MSNDSFFDMVKRRMGTEGFEDFNETELMSKFKSMDANGLNLNLLGSTVHHLISNMNDILELEKEGIRQLAISNMAYRYLITLLSPDSLSDMDDVIYTISDGISKQIDDNKI